MTSLVAGWDPSYAGIYKKMIKNIRRRDVFMCMVTSFENI